MRRVVPSVLPSAAFPSVFPRGETMDLWHSNPNKCYDMVHQRTWGIFLRKASATMCDTGRAEKHREQYHISLEMVARSKASLDKGVNQGALNSIAKIDTNHAIRGRAQRRQLIFQLLFFVAIDQA